MTCWWSSDSSFSCHYVLLKEGVVCCTFVQDTSHHQILFYQMELCVVDTSLKSSFTQHVADYGLVCLMMNIKM